MVVCNDIVTIEHDRWRPGLPNAPVVDQQTLTYSRTKLSSSKSAYSSSPPASKLSFSFSPLDFSFKLVLVVTRSGTHQSSENSLDSERTVDSLSWSTLKRQATPRVTRNCLSAGRCARAIEGSPDAHSHVGHAATNASPDLTNSSGVSKPCWIKADDFIIQVWG